MNEGFSTRRAEIEAAMAGRGLEGTAGNQRLAERAALMTRAHKRNVDKAALKEIWEKQAAGLGFDARALAAEAASKEAGRESAAARGTDYVAPETAGTPAAVAAQRPAGRQPDTKEPAAEAVEWAVAHIAEREAVFSRSDLLAAVLAWRPGAVPVEAAEKAIGGIEAAGRLHAAPALHGGDGMTTDRALADERETVGLMREGRDRSGPVMRSWMVSARLHKGPLTEGQREAVKLILSAKDRVVGVQGYAGTGKTTMLRRARALAEKNGYRMAGLAPSASAVKTLATEAGKGERLVSRGYTNAEKALAANYAPGDVVAFHRPYRRIAVEKGEERRVSGVDHENGQVVLGDGKGGTVRWKPAEIGGRRGGAEVYRSEGIELRAGDRIRWTRNDKGLGLVNSRTAEVLAVKDSRVALQLEDGRRLDLEKGDPQLRHLDHAWCSTVHAFQGRTVDNVIAAAEANHPHLTTQKSFYVEISRARDRAELVTDDARALRERLEAATGERISALEGIGESARNGKGMEGASRESGTPGREAERGGPASGDRDPPAPAREKAAEMDLGL